MGSVCEICGRTENEVEENEQFSMDYLHICEQCRGDRQSEPPNPLS